MACRYDKGTAFSLIELLVALAILAVVSTLVIPKFLALHVKAEDAVARAMMKQLNSTYLQWRALGGEPNDSAPFEVIYFLSKVPDSVTGERDCSVGNCTDTRGKMGSVTVALSGIDIILEDNTYLADKKNVQRDSSKNAYMAGWWRLWVIKVDRTIWNPV
jgi:prepilin-type N-terminal cleavage/methylation domain-containing protein